MTILGMQQPIRPLWDRGQTERSTLHLCHAQIQLMENVFLAVQLDKYHAHPLNRGWMNLFRRWAAADDFRKLWPALRGGFSKTFVDFAGTELNLADNDQVVMCKIQGPALFTITKVHGPEHSSTSATIDFAILEKEFKQEWPRHKTQLGFPSCLKWSRSSTSPHIFVAIPPHGAEPGGHVLGVLFAIRWRSRPTWRVFVWIRGAHRRVGIGGKLLGALLEQLPSEAGRKLIVVLPELLRERPGYALEKAGWLHFFGRRGFQLVSEEGLYRLERTN